ncbi:MAG: hypothetical protein KF709_07580 [Gemmatimonadaceae bacterium]|nr:hypothetical protein [Gemmatimonadaceae bacterium]
MSTRRRSLVPTLLFLAASLGISPNASAQGPRFTVTFPAARSAAPIDGRVLLFISADTTGEPRFASSFNVGTAQVTGVDVDGWRPGAPTVVDAIAFGYPVASLRDLPPGRYRVQALVNRYQTFRRSDGFTVKLPPDHWEGQQFARKPGNLYSKPVTVSLDARSRISLELSEEIPPVADFALKETKYVKYVRIRSERLSQFWGTDMYLGAWVLLPEGFDSHPDARYPLVLNHGHFPSGVDGWRETPPDTTLAPDYSTRFSLAGYNRIQQQLAHQLYKDWTGPGFPRMLVVQVQHATPFYDDSYAVNSANNGPYGDAINYELIPEIERRFRGIGQGWARFTYGGSTGGWEAMAVQMFYPDFFNGAWIACPDPIDFRHYTSINIYEDRNAYYTEGPFRRTRRPAYRNYLGHILATVEDMNLRELALGTRTRSGDQFDVWESVYSPVGPDGYPKPIWDKRTGVIDTAVARHWRDNWDLNHILQRDWATLGPKLRGKLRIYVGDMDNYYLNNAVYETEKFLRTASPPADAVVDYGDRDEHCWNGDHTRSNAYSRLRYPQMVLPWALERILLTAPPGADVRSWRY